MSFDALAKAAGSAREFREGGKCVRYTRGDRIPHEFSIMATIKACRRQFFIVAKDVPTSGCMKFCVNAIVRAADQMIGIAS